jgi:hypothetical protein
VLPTDRGREVISIAQRLVPDVENQITDLLGADRLGAMREDLNIIRRTFAP